MFREVTVIIDVLGSTASGKTTVGVIIEKALKDAGFNVSPFENRDGDVNGTRNALDSGKLLPSLNPSHCSVTIHETQLPRGYPV